MTESRRHRDDSAFIRKKLAQLLRSDLSIVRCRNILGDRIFTFRRIGRERMDPGDFSPGLGARCPERCLIGRTGIHVASPLHCRQDACRSGRCDASLLRRRDRLSVVFKIINTVTSYLILQHLQYINYSVNSCSSQHVTDQIKPIMSIAYQGIAHNEIMNNNIITYTIK